MLCRFPNDLQSTDNRKVELIVFFECLKIRG
jgi:hypothetical protein